MPKVKKVKLEKLVQIDGKDEETPKRRFTTLDQIWGDTGTSRYKTMDLTVYEEQLAEMNLADLQAEAVRAQLIPSHGRAILIDRLKREFRKHVSQYEAQYEQPSKPVKISRETQMVLDEGR